MSAQSRIIFLEAEIKRLQAEIAALKCCGNCAKWNCNNCQDISIESNKYANFRNNTDKCDKWQARHD